MAKWERAPDLEELAEQLIQRYEQVAHVEIDETLFLKEFETKPKALARCYNLNDHPIGLYTDKRWAIVFYEANCDYMTPQQRALLMLHELMHIPARGNKLVDHDVKDFRVVLGIDLDWAEPGREVPDIMR